MQYSWEDCWEVVTEENPSSTRDWMAFEQAADRIGYREVVDTPIAYLVPYDAGEPGQGLRSRTKMLAAHYEDELPLINLMHDDIDREALNKIRTASDYDAFSIRLSPRADLDTTVEDYLRDSTFYRPLDRIEADVLNDKDHMRDTFKDSEMPILPGHDIGSVVLSGLHSDKLDAFDSYVLLPTEGGTGRGVTKVSTTEEAVEYLTQTKTGRGWYEYFRDQKEADTRGYRPCGIQVEPFIEHEADIRMYVGDGVLSAEERTGRDDDFRCNLSLLDGCSVTEKAYRARETGAAQVLSVEHDVDDVEPLPEPLHRIGEDLIDELYGAPEDYLLPIDIMVADREQAERLPAVWRDPILKYADDDHAYILSEINLVGGDIISQLHYWDGPREELPIIHEYRQLQKLAGLNPIEPEDVVDNPDNDLWQRIDNHYTDLAVARDQFSV